MSADLVDPTRASPLRRTGPSRHQTIKAKAHCTNDPATPKPRLSDRTIETSAQPSTRAVIFDSDHCRSRPNRSDLSLREMSFLVGRCLPGRRRECRGELQPPLPEGQPPHAALTQSGRERRSQDQRKHLRNRVSPLSPAPGTQSSHRGHCPSTVSTDLAHSAPRSSLRRTGHRRHQAVKAKAQGENDPATPKPRLSDRSTESSTQPSTGAVIFEIHVGMQEKTAERATVAGNS